MALAGRGERVKNETLKSVETFSDFFAGGAVALAVYHHEWLRAGIMFAMALALLALFLWEKYRRARELTKQSRIWNR